MTFNLPYKKGIRTKRRWTIDETIFLLENAPPPTRLLGKMTLKEITERFGRTYGSVSKKCQALMLRRLTEVDRVNAIELLEGVKELEKCQPETRRGVISHIAYIDENFAQMVINLYKRYFHEHPF
jgi:hypothetical protein